MSNIVYAFNMGDEVIDIYFLLRGRVCDMLSNNRIEVDFLVTTEDIKRLQLKPSSNHINKVISGIYKQGLILALDGASRTLPGQTLLPIEIFNGLIGKLTHIQKYLNTTQFVERQ